MLFYTIVFPVGLLLAVVPGNADAACQSTIKQREADNSHNHCGCAHARLLLQYFDKA
jgi:hypothetical protein